MRVMPSGMAPLFGAHLCGPAAASASERTPHPFRPPRRNVCALTINPIEILDNSGMSRGWRVSMIQRGQVIAVAGVGCRRRGSPLTPEEQDGSARSLFPPGARSRSHPGDGVGR